MGMTLPIGIVIIGKNESRRLGLSLRQAKRQSDALVYVDSHSTDGSVAIAEALGCPVLQLNPRQPPSAALARNEGLRWLTSRLPSIRYIQFVDGDCELSMDWIRSGVSFLEKHPQHGAISGFLTELAPDASVFNFLCSLEWDRTIGELRSCGGLAMVRVEAFVKAGGFDIQLVAGEEAQLYGAMRDNGWKVERIALPMAVHDANITSFKDWFRRSARGGKATYLAFQHYKGSAKKEATPELVRTFAWSGIGILGLFFSITSPTWGFTLLSLFPVLFLKIFLTQIFRQRLPMKKACVYAFFICLEKVPRFFGLVQGFLKNTFTRKIT